MNDNPKLGLWRAEVDGRPPPQKFHWQRVKFFLVMSVLLRPPEKNSSRPPWKLRKAMFNLPSTHYSMELLKAEFWLPESITITRTQFNNTTCLSAGYFAFHIGEMFSYFLHELELYSDFWLSISRIRVADKFQILNH